jgi:hypothetical protein
MSDPAGSGTSLYVMKVPEPKAGKNRLHPDLVTAGSIEAEVRAWRKPSTDHIA